MVLLLIFRSRAFHTKQKKLCKNERRVGAADALAPGVLMAQLQLLLLVLPVFALADDRESSA